MSSLLISSVLLIIIGMNMGVAMCKNKPAITYIVSIFMALGVFVYMYNNFITVKCEEDCIDEEEVKNSYQKHNKSYLNLFVINRFVFFSY